MVPRKILTFLVFALPVLMVAFGVLMSGYLLAEAPGDAVGARVLRWISVGVLICAVIDLVLLAGALGINALAESDSDSNDSDSNDSDSNDRAP